MNENQKLSLIIIVGGITNATPYGFLRKVISVSLEGEQFIVETEFASLSEAFPFGVIDEVISYASSSDIQSSTLYDGVSFTTTTNGEDGFYFNYELIDVVLFDYDGNKETTYDQVKVNRHLA